MRFIFFQGVSNSLIIGGNDNLFDSPAFAHLIDDVLDQWPAGFVGKEFGGKTGGSIAGGNDDCRSQVRPRFSCQKRPTQTAGRMYECSKGMSNQPGIRDTHRFERGGCVRYGSGVF